MLEMPHCGRSCTIQPPVQVLPLAADLNEVRKLPTPAMPDGSHQYAAHDCALPRHEMPEPLRNRRPSKAEGAGNAGCTNAPTALRANEKDARRPTQVRRNHSGTPCAMVLRLLRALPGVPGFLATIACRSSRQARPQRRGDRTTRLDRTHRAARLAAQRDHRSPHHES